MSDLIESLDSGILTLTINRPKKHNTLTATLADALKDALARCANEPKVRCVVITATGRVFCAGGDVGSQASDANSETVSDPETAHAAMVRTIRNGVDLFGMLHSLPKPTLSVLPGAAAGAGLALALACDLRFCLDTAKLTTAFTKVGLSCDSGLSYFLPRLVGSAKARELCFTADVITGSEAMKIGLVSKIASQETFAQDARAYAERLASLPTVAIGYMKENLNASEHSSLDEILDLESENVVRSMATRDHKNAALAFMKKRQVIFEGR